MLRKFAYALVAGAFIAGFAYVAQPIAQSIGIIVRAQDGVSNQSSISGSTDQTRGLYFGSGFTGIIGHLVSGNQTATIPACTTNCNLSTGSDDKAGEFSTTSTSALLTFGTAYTSIPTCVVMTNVGGLSPAVPTYSVSTIQMSLTIALNGAQYKYICFGKSGG